MQIICTVYATLGQLILLSSDNVDFSPTGQFSGGKRKSGGLQNRLYWFHAGKSKNERAAIYILKLGLRGSRFVFSVFPAAIRFFVFFFLFILFLGPVLAKFIGHMFR